MSFILKSWRIASWWKQPNSSQKIEPTIIVSKDKMSGSTWIVRTRISVELSRTSRSMNSWSISSRQRSEAWTHYNRRSQGPPDRSQTQDTAHCLSSSRLTWAEIHRSQIRDVVRIHRKACRETIFYRFCVNFKLVKYISTRPCWPQLPVNRAGPYSGFPTNITMATTLIPISGRDVHTCT
jgi:hypothetical protein